MSSSDRREEVPSEKEISYMDSNGYDAAAGAKNATAREHDMTVGQSIKLYYPAILWSILLSATVVMEGYDVNLMSNLFPMQSFSSKYGVKMENGIYEVTALWKTGLANGALVGQIIGLWLSGIIAEKLGSRKTMIIFLIMMILAVFAPFFAPNVIVLTIGQVLCGLPWGAFQTLPAAYASEVCPTKLRAYLCTYVNLCWVFGQLIASGILRAMLGRTDEWSYKIPFALQWLWPLPILVGVFFAPESPWWLVRHGRKEEAKHAILRLTSRKSGIEFSADEQIAMIEQTNNAEMSIAEGTSYMDCFKGIDRRRTEVACITWLIQASCGSNLMGWSTYFYAQAGLQQKMAYNMSLGQYAIGFFGTIGSWWMMSGVGRRKIYLYGLCGLFVVLLAVGGLACLPDGTSTKGWAIGSALLVFAGVYNSSVGPVCYALVAEVSSTRLKGKTIALARLSYNIGNIISTVITTYQLSPPGGEVNGWGWYAKSGFFWAGSCAICIGWCFFRLPEPKDRTYAEMDELFERKTPARKFSKTDVSVFDDMEVKNGTEEKDRAGSSIVKEVEKV